MNDKWFRLIGIPVVAAVMHVTFGGWSVQYNATEAKQFGFSFFITLMLWEGNRANFLFMRRLFPRYHQTMQRLVLQTVVSIGFTAVATLIFSQVYWALFHAPMCVQGGFMYAFLLKLVPTFMVTSVYESAYFFGEWKKNFQRSEALTRAGIQSELETLRSQLDPHFLFNSLNTLAALIDDDNDPAHKYLEQLADVYRYVLLSRDKTTVPLHEEMAFVDAYLYLNQTRFRDNLQVERDIDPAAYARRVAPLSLQMLVENAIKHNVISPQNPLRVRLQASACSGSTGGSPASDEGEAYFSVANNLQPKTGLEQSTKVGLRNIINRYRLLSARPVEVLRDNGLFTVRVPLLTQ